MRWLARLTWLLSTAVVVVFVVWAEAMSRSIGFAQLVLFVIGGPRVELSNQPLWVEAAFDFGMLFAVGFAYTRLAARAVPRHVVVALGLVLVMNNWQVLDRTVWELFPSSPAFTRVFMNLYYLMIVVAWRTRRHRWLLVGLLCANTLKLDRLVMFAAVLAHALFRYFQKR